MTRWNSLTALAVLFESSFGPTGAPWSPALIGGIALTIAIPVVTLLVVSRRRAPIGCAGTLAIGLVVGAAMTLRR